MMRVTRKRSTVKTYKEDEEEEDDLGDDHHIDNDEDEIKSMENHDEEEEYNDNDIKPTKKKVKINVKKNDKQKKRPRLLLPKIDGLSTASVESANKYQDGLDQWKKNVREQCASIPVEELNDASIKRILDVHEIMSAGTRVVRERRIKRLWEGKPNMMKSLHVFGKCYRQPIVIRHFAGNVQQSSFRPGWADLLKNIIVKKLDLDDLFNLMYTCKFMFNIVYSVLCTMATNKFGTFGTVMMFRFEEYLKWVQKSDLVTTGFVKQRFGLSSGKSHMTVRDNFEFHRVGYIDYLKTNTRLYLEHLDAKRLDLEYGTRQRQGNVDALNDCLKLLDMEFLCVRRKGGIIVFDNFIIEQLFIKRLSWILKYIPRTTIFKKEEIASFCRENSHVINVARSFSKMSHYNYTRGTFYRHNVSEKACKAFIGMDEVFFIFHSDTLMKSLESVLNDERGLRTYQTTIIWLYFTETKRFETLVTTFGDIPKVKEHFEQFVNMRIPPPKRVITFSKPRYYAEIKG